MYGGFSSSACCLSPGGTVEPGGVGHAESRRFGLIFSGQGRAFRKALYWVGAGDGLRVLRVVLGVFGREPITVVRPVGGFRGRMGTSAIWRCVYRYC